jgi:hypothetical protein
MIPDWNAPDFKIPWPMNSKTTDSIFDALLADALSIQERFVAEPMLKTTGRGYLKSRGVEGLKQDAAELKAKYQKQHVDTKLAR